jgi:hypothetical protein
MRRGWIGRLLAVLAAAWMAGAQAGDVTYTFNVPVDLKALPEDVQAFVDCRVAPTPDYVEQNNELRVTQRVPLVDGNHAGVVAVSLVLSGEVAMTIRSWQCLLGLGRENTQSWSVAREANNVHCPDSPWYCAKSGTVLVNRVQGSFEQPGATQ